MQEILNSPEVRVVIIAAFGSIVTALAGLAVAIINGASKKFQRSIDDATALRLIQDATTAAVDDLMDMARQLKAASADGAIGIEDRRKLLTAARVKIADTLKEQGVPLAKYYTEKTLNGLIARTVQGMRHETKPLTPSGTLGAIIAADSPKGA